MIIGIAPPAITAIIRYLINSSMYYTHLHNYGIQCNCTIFTKYCTLKSPQNGNLFVLDSLKTIIYLSGN